MVILIAQLSSGDDDDEQAERAKAECDTQVYARTADFLCFALKFVRI